MKPHMILKPGERASINLPWRGSRSANYEWLKEVCGERTRPDFDHETKRFLVARLHARHVINALVNEFGQVLITQYGNTATTCVEQCWNAKLETTADCVCGCAGANHGSGHPMDKEVKADLSVKQELTRAEYLVTADGWKVRPKGRV